MKLLKYKECPVEILAIGADDATALGIADNKSSDNSAYDFAFVADDILALDANNYPMDALGMSEQEIEQMMNWTPNPDDPNAEWAGMPEYENEDKTAYRTIYAHFRNQEDVDAFAKLIGQELKEKTKYIWIPEIEKEKSHNKKYKDES